ncbi:NYN domain protein [Thiorhodovibrio litoralis]|nr:NYN domain protein [Thiorhodovibrio litoralis]
MARAAKKKTDTNVTNLGFEAQLWLVAAKKTGVTLVSPRLVAKIAAEEPTIRLAVLIDADNAQAAVIDGLLAEIARFGEATVKRIYGDFTSPTSSSWKKVLQQYAIKPVQQFAYTTGKNATDSTLIIDAMDLLYTRKFDGFCLITSDSDFTGLAMRIREEGLTVLAGLSHQRLIIYF